MSLDLQPGSWRLGLAVSPEARVSGVARRLGHALIGYSTFKFTVQEKGLQLALDMLI